MDFNKLNKYLDFQTVENKNILITGGTTGIGRATAVLLGSLGAKVFIYGRHDEPLQDAIKDIEAAGGEVVGMTADQSNTDEIKEIFNEFDKKLGRLDILINNAALGGKAIEDGDHESWKYIVESNLHGYMACTLEAVERMKPNKKGFIVNIGSLSADERDKGSSIYVATKAAIQAFSESLRKEVNKDGIKVALVEPGLVGTDMQPQSPKEQRQMEEKHEMLKAEDIAFAVLYCLIQPERCDVIDLKIRPHLQLI